MTSVADAVLQRRSTRAFLDRPVSHDLMMQILDIARRAPSSGNVQPWKLSIMTGSDLEIFRQRVRDSLAGNPKGEDAEYKIYADEMRDPYLARRYKCGEDLYATIDVTRDNKPARHAQFRRNFEFFGAPVGMVLSIDRSHGPGQWADAGIFLQTLMLLLHERGLATCAQAAWALAGKSIRAHLDLPEQFIIVCGIALGYADPDAPINGLVTERASLSEIADLRGFPERDSASKAA